MSLNTNLSPRQRMINLMYIVLTAMLALNISSDVLTGFEIVGESMVRTASSTKLQNRSILSDLKAFTRKNPEKAGAWYDKAISIHQQSQELYDLLEDLKIEMVKYADGDQGDVENIVHRDNQEASSHVMLSSAGGRGKELLDAVVGFRESAASLIDDPAKRKAIISHLSTEVADRSIGLGKNWQEVMFENMPLIASVAILSKIQSDVLYVESEVLHTLSSNVDKKDVRVNVLKPYVIPASKNIMAGSSYSAHIVLAAIDSTQHPDIYIDGVKLADEKRGFYETTAYKKGKNQISGHLAVSQRDGTTINYPFSDNYTVVDPSATVSATMMNLLYAGIDNPVSISVPGVPSEYISASITNGSLTRNNERWIAKPSKASAESEITVTATIEGRSQVVNKTIFRVRPLPPPSPHIQYKDRSGVAQRYKGGTPISKSLLMEAQGIGAAIDDDILNINFRVLGFETVFFDSMGNAIPELSQGADFSQRQKESFRRMARGKRFYISHVRAIGPDGVERKLNTSMEVIVQ